MTAVIRLRRDLFEAIHADLGRRHPHAWERIGFLYGKLAYAGTLSIVLPCEYTPVPDAQYIVDDTVGARVDSNTIFDAHDRASRTGMCCLHVHCHSGQGRTWFSAIDLETLRGIGPSLQRVAADAAHGGLVLTYVGGAALLWMPGLRDPVSSDVTVVGFPLTLHRGSTHGP